MPAPTVGPGYELQRRLVEVFTADSTLNSLLFPAWSPQRDASDLRIYGISPSINNRLTIDALPRVIIEVVQDASNWEQYDPSDSGPADVYMHTLTPSDHY